MCAAHYWGQEHMLLPPPLLLLLQGEGKPAEARVSSALLWREAGRRLRVLLRVLLLEHR